MRQDLCVLHGDRCGYREQLADLRRLVDAILPTLMHGPSPIPYWMASISRTNGALATMVSARSSSIIVRPAPSAWGWPAPQKVAT
ncbi:MAG TPA: hypothetical protein VES60_15355 [Nakamurella sp.]|nr:hypothetical protein [Nakamurella sp.]